MKLKDVVIIEDDEFMAGFLNKTLTMKDYTVHVFRSAEEFLTSMDKLPELSFFLLDLNLPGLQGSQLIRLIKRRNDLTPVFIVSGEEDSKIVEDCFTFGADDFLPKPVDPVLLISKIRTTERKLELMSDTSLERGLKIIREAKVISLDGKKTVLSNKEFDVFMAFLNSPEKLLTPEALKNLFPNSHLKHVSSISASISLLRKKLHQIGLTIKSERKTGYRLHFPLTITSWKEL